MAINPTNPGPGAAPGFLNRQDELQALQSLLVDAQGPACVLVLRAPSGFGKTTLVEHLLRIHGDLPGPVLRVDPGRLSAGHAMRVYEGYFIQRAATALDALAKEGRPGLQPFKAFVETRRKEMLRAADLGAHVRGARGLLSGAYGLVVELMDRGLGTGRYSATKMLVTDDKLSVEMSRRYLAESLPGKPAVLVVREAQHIDATSLDCFIELAAAARSRILLEYTTSPEDPQTFRPEHVRPLDRAGIPQDVEFRTLDLIRLESRYVDQLLRDSLKDRPPDSGFYTSWDGNIRRITELRWSALAGPASPSVLEQSLLTRFHAMPRESQLLCLLVARHAEPMLAEELQDILLSLAEKQTWLLSHQDVHKRVDALVRPAGFLVETADRRLAISNDDVAQALARDPRARGLATLASSAIRDYYLGLLTASADAASRQGAAAARRGLKAAIELSDETGIQHFKAAVDARLAQVADKRIYAAMVLQVLRGNAMVKTPQLDALVDWATRLAFDVGDYALAGEILAFRSSPTAHTNLLDATIACETNQHERTASLAASLAVHANPSIGLAARMLQMVLLRLQGRIGELRILWTGSIAEFDPASACYGHLLRFRELAWDFDQCTDDLARSTEWFEERGHAQCAAYSRAAMAFHLARQGRFIESREAIDAALASLSSTPHDRHMVLNNRAAIELFAAEPDLDLCDALFGKALQLSSDGYSDLVISINYGIALARLDKPDRARAALDRALGILDQPAFLDREVYWSALFNASQIAQALGDSELDKAIRLRVEALRPHALQADLWAYRSGAAPSAPDKYAALLNLQHYPLFLSHWLIEPEVLFSL